MSPTSPKRFVLDTADAEVAVFMLGGRYLVAVLRPAPDDDGFASIAVYDVRALEFDVWYVTDRPRATGAWGIARQTISPHDHWHDGAIGVSQLNEAISKALALNRSRFGPREPAFNPGASALLRAHRKLTDAIDAMNAAIDASGSTSLVDAMLALHAQRDRLHGSMSDAERAHLRATEQSG